MKYDLIRLVFILLLLLPATTLWSAPVTFTVAHTFSIDDVQGDFLNGRTYAQNPMILCGPAGSPACPEQGPQPLTVDATTLFPIDSEFGFYVVDFVGGFTKTLDGAYTEGFIGPYSDSFGDGVITSNAVTERFKTPQSQGTWCAGMGGTSVKCSTENFAVLEHILTCFETIPYFYADPVSGSQGILTDPATNVPIFTCADAQINNFDDLTLPSGIIDLLAMAPNESNLRDIATGKDYSVTLKDDGKFLFRWGTFVKRPNDIRLYAQLPLPAAWKVPGNDFPVTRATLAVRHWITNNPNDQIRPEDMENEGATGRKPGYRVLPDGSWVSDRDCFEGDGNAIAEGTYYRNRTAYTLPTDPRALRVADLAEGLTNAWATSIDRDPFEWSYDANPAADIQDFVGSLTPMPALGDLVSGPRWRLRANKFGQDIPALEIPLAECSAETFSRSYTEPRPRVDDNVKYVTGSFAVTTINLLDFEDINDNGIADDSPLLSTSGWVDAAQNIQNIGANGSNSAPNGVSINGLPLTEDFDLGIYIKGDRRPTVVYDASLFVEWDDGTAAGAPGKPAPELPNPGKGE
ncbi:MAG: hypothetical protein Tsb002_02310 [Wenzhouxiangellaceae bacterium]